MKLSVWMLAMTAAATLGACQGQPADSAAETASQTSNAVTDSAVAATQPPLLPNSSPVPASVAQLETEAAVASPKPGTRPATDEDEVFLDLDDAVNPPAPNGMGRKVAAQPGLCWQDYCPCVNPVNALDRTICRNARAGVEMSDDQWSIGAGAREMKRESDQLTRQANEGIAEINANRIRDRGN